METETEMTVGELKAAIKRETNPLEKSNLQFKLSSLIKELARQHEREQIRRFAGNSF